MLNAEKLNGLTSRIPNQQVDAEQLANRERVRLAVAKMSRPETVNYADHLLQNQHQPMKKVGSEIEISTADLDFLIADSLQYMYSEEDPVAEYHDWVQSEGKIVADINDGDTTQADLDAKHSFLNEFVDRETELKLCISLFSASAMNCKGEFKEKALEKLKFLNFKLSELRRLRSALRDTKDKTTDQEKREMKMMEKTQEITRTAAEMYVFNKVGMAAQGLENGIADDIVEFRPVSTSREQAIAKIQAYRMGKTLEDAPVKRLVTPRQGFSIDLYKKSRQNQQQVQV